MNIKTFFKNTPLALAVVLFGMTASYAQQPVIQVPATCNVVVAGTGTGAVTGLGGKVGDGGIVTMPDPFDFTTTPIVGPDCLLPNTIYTYSIDKIASDNANDAMGFDKYFWSGIPAGAINIYTSADESSITFKTGGTVAPFTLKCGFGRANDWDVSATNNPSAFVTKAVGASISIPSFTGGTPPPTCLATGITTFNVVIPTTSVISTNTYTWTAPGTSWLLTSSGAISGQNLTVSNIDNNSGKLVLTICNGLCSPRIIEYSINRNFVASHN